MSRELSACVAARSRGAHSGPIAIVNHPTPRLSLVDALPAGLVGGDLDDHLLEDRVTERLEVFCHDHERAWAADHVVAEVLIEIRLNRQDRQSVDGDVLRHGLVAGADNRAATIVGAVAGNVDDQPLGLERGRANMVIA